MGFKEFIKSPGLKKAVGVLAVLGAGLSAITSAIGEQKKEQEFEALKEAVSELQKK